MTLTHRWAARVQLAAVIVWLLLGSAAAARATTFRAVADKLTYNAGDEAKIRVSVESQGQKAVIRLVAQVRYRGASPIVNAKAAPPPVRSVLYTGSEPPSGYIALWKIPPDAATGRYDVDFEVVDPASGRQREGQEKVASFAVHRKLVRIDRIELDKTFYTSGDPVAATVEIVNLTPKPLRGLRVEFSDRYWPWIAGPAEQAKASIVPMSTSLDLPAASSTGTRGATSGSVARRTVSGDRLAVAPQVKTPSLHQYGVVVWDHDRKNVLDIAFSRLAFVDPPGVRSPRPYPGQYVYPELKDVKVTAYRHFYRAGEDSAAIAFDHAHTLYPPGATATVSFQLTDTDATPWRGAHVQARLLTAKGNELATNVVADGLNLEPAAKPTEKTTVFHLPGESGLYHVQVWVAGASGETLAQSSLELAVNPLPKSVMIFCAHEDDEGGWHWLIRAAVENNVPLLMVYFTGGDAGSCDRYYERSCGPAEALNFGEIRMQETRAVLAHLGLPATSLMFLGLPDGGSGEIWYHHPNPENPYLAPLLASDHAPYESLVSPNLPYARDAVVKTAEELIERFKPEVIVTAHPPAEGHIDHIVNNYFVVKALQELGRRGAVPPGVKVLVDKVYVAKEAPPTPYHYQEHTFYVSGEAAALAQEAGWYYQSQGGNHGEGNFKDFPRLSRQGTYREVLDWNQHEGWNHMPPAAPKQ
ncbi:MAG TPA: PIG-L family deacetylase [Terriglobia bacterium]|nr:PIG-L family deacetylase [Terriglobia bacterium]